MFFYSIQWEIKMRLLLASLMSSETASSCGTWLPSSLFNSWPSEPCQHQRPRTITKHYNDNSDERSIGDDDDDNGDDDDDWRWTMVMMIMMMMMVMMMIGAALTCLICSSRYIFISSNTLEGSDASESPCEREKRRINGQESLYWWAVVWMLTVIHGWFSSSLAVRLWAGSTFKSPSKRFLAAKYNHSSVSWGNSPQSK